MLGKTTFLHPSLAFCKAIFWGRRGTQSADVDAKPKNEASAFLLLENSSVASSPEAAYKKKRRQKMVRKGYENFASASVGYSPVSSKI